ncbi:MAG: glycosyltransferase [Nanoarchaeota archaeon]|nr:glycosyltransferase [Nanoarchaeota archaeon]
MSCYNESIDYFRLAVDSILSQTYDNFELIIILDNVNNDLLLNEILNYSKKDNRIVFLKNKKNRGLSYSLNKGIKIAKGNYIARMDADDISVSNRFEKQLNFIIKQEADLVFTWVKYIDEKNILKDKFMPERNKVKKIKNNFFKEHLLVHPTLLCKASVLKENLYDETQLRSQDFELWIRLIIKNYKFELLESFLLDYRILDETNYDKRVNKVKNSYFYGLKALKKNKFVATEMDGFSSIYYNFMFMNSMFKVFPKRFIKSLVLIKDILKK